MIQNDILEKALIFAVKKHTGQKRKGNGTPYILHPSRVATIVYYAKKSSNINLIMAICLLHDVVEDCDVTLAEIARRFGHHVAGCVDELTTDKELCKQMGKAEYLLSKMLKMSSYSLCVKLADRLDNLRDMSSLNFDTKCRTINQTIFILKGLKERKLTATHQKLIALIEKEITEATKQISL